eukprot:COSAG06_NODE_11151_length_1555_cov_2.811126_2_plen_138_part_00
MSPVHQTRKKANGLSHEQKMYVARLCHVQQQQHRHARGHLTAAHKAAVLEAFVTQYGDGDSGKANAFMTAQNPEKYLAQHEAPPTPPPPQSPPPPEAVAESAAESVAPAAVVVVGVVAPAVVVGVVPVMAHAMPVYE